MGFNYGLEKKNFDRQWAIMRKQYEDAGMSIEVIQAMYEYDWSVFNAARSYQNHTQEITAPSFEQGEESYSPLMIHIVKMQLLGKDFHTFCHSLAFALCKFPPLLCRSFRT